MSRTGLHPEEKRSLVGMGAAVLALHLAGWGLLFGFVLPAVSAAGGHPALLAGLAVSAYALGIRHAFDADHIAAIDNATRRLIAAGRRPMTAGFWFALGHSTVVLSAVVLLLAGLDAFAGSLADEGSGLRQTTSIWGGTVSGLFLLLTGVLNLSSLRGMGSALSSARSGQLSESEMAGHLDRRGVLARVFRPLARLVDRAWKMYPTGFLFGLGLDTAASISLFVAGALTPGLPRYAVLVLPLLFTAGMALFDSADGVFMNRVYRWAAMDQRRKIYYNLVVTAVSVLVAFFVGATGLASVAAEMLGVRTGPLDVIAAVDIRFLGVALVVFFAAVWLFAAARARNRALPVSARAGR
ncbi:HoxN/HupN/NixA family nickel/cobalt transporter [Paenarthrobacter sp. DKR-5]|uniref:HoxN/HupN/NixA family nickel/cobalt transporter n=1 Tax=Paenarthrobacter sp. DKR-5 TaxID=2835535 RepID=UPI001BDD4D6A|nr:HoxN/HupN/NixA family nickel/cobalt transporter [Paenarthrobacter sp. DKR-5]MBT1004399.1 HoxN/HupN/NixA family nickel/cobalt transporter [Paenarthrobacter sp. DKR-5]